MALAVTKDIAEDIWSQIVVVLPWSSDFFLIRPSVRPARLTALQALSRIPVTSSSQPLE